MRVSASSPDLIAAVVGTGTMGRGIAQVCATAGFRTILYDAQPGSAKGAQDFVFGMLDRQVEKGAIEGESADSAKARLEVAEEIGDLARCDVVFEAIVEDVAAKQNLFVELEDVASDECIFASNTSALSVTLIAKKCRRPERVAGTHYFNPVPLMPLVEIISGIKTEAWVVEALTTINERMGRTPVIAKDTPGFLAGQIGRGSTLEAAHIVQEGIASFADVDRIMRDVGKFRMGPFQLIDLAGLDVVHSVMESVYDQLYYEPYFRPSFMLRNRSASGLHGRKTGEGFFHYPDRKTMETPPEDPSPDLKPEKVWVSPAEPDGHEQLVRLLQGLDVHLDQDSTPGEDALCLVTPVGDDATTTALAQGLDPSRTVAVDTLFGLSGRRTIMGTPLTETAHIQGARALLSSDDAPVTVIKDSPGFVAQRVVCNIVNVGSTLAHYGIASPEDVDKAATLGLGYPHGPLAYGDKIGPRNVLRVLAGLQRATGDPRYRPTPWLSRRAQLGASLLQENRY